MKTLRLSLHLYSIRKVISKKIILQFTIQVKKLFHSKKMKIIRLSLNLNKKCHFVKGNTTVYNTRSKLFSLKENENTTFLTTSYSMRKIIAINGNSTVYTTNLQTISF